MSTSADATRGAGPRDRSRPAMLAPGGAVHHPSASNDPSSSQASGARVGAQSFLALLLLIATLPFWVVVGALVWISDGRPIFYRGTRLGRERRPFTIWKFRTLRCGAQQVIGSRLLSDRHGLTIRGGRVLRACRLDELPQLLNIVRGEMNFWGPRPERPEVYEEKCRTIPGYDQRFRVAPGLVGLSQLFTPHNTPKALRVRIDNAMLADAPSLGRQVGIVAYTGACALATAARGCLDWLTTDLWACRVRRRRNQLRGSRRFRWSGAQVHVELPSENAVRPVGTLVDLNDDWVRVSTTDLPLESRHPVIVLSVPVRRHGRTSFRHARCRVLEVKEAPARTAQDAPELLLRYESADPSSHYVLHQYFLGKSLATPARIGIRTDRRPTPTLPLGARAARTQPRATTANRVPTTRETVRHTEKERARTPA